MASNIAPFRHPAFRGLVGVARSDITPPSGIYARNWGAASHDAAEGVHRPLTLTALAIQARGDSDPLVLVDADAGWWRSIQLERRFRTRLLKALKLDPARLIVALTHTHAAVPLTDQADPDWRGAELLAADLEQLHQAALDAVTQALQGARVATLAWHTGRCSLAAARDLADPDSHRARRICGFDPTPIADDTLLVGRLTDADGGAAATICNYACHPTTLAWENRLISPDFVGAMRQTVEHATGAPALFLQGASGELAPRHQYVGDPAVADRHGRQLGHAVLATLADMEPPGQRLAFAGTVESGAPLAVWRNEPDGACETLACRCLSVELPLKEWPSAQELERQRTATDDRTLRERLRRKLNVRRSLGDGRTFELPVWVWHVGDAVLIGSMAEAYSWLQQHLRLRFADRAIVYLNHANGTSGYLPTENLYDEDVYQVWQTPFDRGSLESLAQAIIGALADCKTEC